MKAVGFISWLALVPFVSAAADETPGHVQIPVAVYNQLVQAMQGATPAPRPAPAGYALGTARVNVTVQGTGPHATAEVRVDLSIVVLEGQWVLVPVLPSGTPVDSATVGGQAVQLVPAPLGLSWATNQEGSHTMTLVYRVDAHRSAKGFAVPLPVPAAASIQLVATLPGTNLDATVIPSAGMRVTPAGASTRVDATVPTTSGLQLSWRVPSLRGYSVSRARYTGRLVGDAIAWTGDLGVELFDDETATVPLLPSGVTLSRLSVDGKETPVFVENGRFATVIKGAGAHAVKIGFETSVLRGDGPPHVELSIPEVPISQFDLVLPGRKELKVTPESSVVSRIEGGATAAVAHVAMTDTVTFAWSEAVPDEIKAEVRTNAAVYHAIHAEEGVLYIQAQIQYEVSRGTTNKLQILVPPGVQVNRIESPGGIIADWRLAPAPPGRPRVATVFLNQEIEDEARIDVHYDRSLGTPGEDLELPLLRATDAQRQRGMVALLATSDLTLDPREDAAGTRVGENQLPAFVRESLKKTVAHTFKYADEPPRMVVRARVPDPVAGKFEAQVDTLASLGEVAVTGAARVLLHVKSGALTALQLELPKDVNLLNLTGPSIRAHRAAVAGDRLVVDVTFTQEMEGELALELTYERILSETQAESQVDVPAPRVRGAEVEQGRIAVEALSAVEVRPASAERLTALDVAELPQQLVLRTTHPILMAYKYVHAEPGPRLTLGLTRHRLAGVQEAAIDRADYRTLFTRDGLQVTTAEFTVRNSRKQFLRLRLPRGATVWSVFVDGKAEKPAVSEGKKGEDPTVLVKIIHSTAGFPVQVVYATEGSPLGGLGRARGVLPRPDILVTQTHWDVYVPAEMSWSSPSTNMNVVGAAARVTRDTMAGQLARTDGADAAVQALDPLRISVPAAGVHYAFEKLYANQAEHDTWIAIPYASGWGAASGRVASAAGAVLFWLGLAIFFKVHPRLPVLAPRLALAMITCGLAVVAICVGRYHVGTIVAIAISLAAAAAALRPYARRLPSLLSAR